MPSIAWSKMNGATAAQAWEMQATGVLGLALLAADADLGAPDAHRVAHA